MPVTEKDLDLLFNSVLILHFKMLKEEYGVRSFEMMPSPGSPLYMEDEDERPVPLYVPLCRNMGLHPIVLQSFDLGKVRFIRTMTERLDRRFVLVDVGANVGLFARQCLAEMAYLSRLYLYEPHPENFEQLTRNMAGQANAELNQFGLGPEPGTFRLYMDPNTCGNYSLNANAVPDGADFADVEIRPSVEEQAKWLSSGEEVIFKSDTQGFDEAIATSLDLEFWKSVRLGTMELWRLPGKEYDEDRFAKILDGFPIKVFQSNPRQPVTTADVIKMNGDGSGDVDDIFFFKP